ncbi:hypothetical protein DYB37_011823, partial [Aphanomyces astaci]
MTTIAPTTQTFNEDIDATGVVQQRPRGEPVHADMTAAATAPTTETADSKGKHLRKMLCQSIDDALSVFAVIVFATSTRVLHSPVETNLISFFLPGLYVLAAALIMALDRHLRDFFAADTSKISRVCIALFCARTSVDIAAYNGDEMPLHTLFKPIEDSTNLADIILAVMVKGLVLRIASLSVKAFVGLVLEWLSVHDTPTITGVSVRDIPSPLRVRRGLELHFALSTASVEPLLLPTHITSSDSVADALLVPANDALIQDHTAATHTHPFDLSFDHSAHEHVPPELLKEDQDPNERSTDAARLDLSPFLSDVKVITTVELDHDDLEDDQDVQDLSPLDVLVSTPYRPRFTDGHTTNVGGKLVPFHAADVRVWWDRRHAYVLPTVAESTAGQ